MFKRFAKYLRNTAARDYEKCILACLDKHPEALLDCGCDDGSWTMELAAKAMPGSLYAIEFVETSARLAENRGIHVTKADLNDRFPFGDNCFDLIHANQVIEHLSDTDNFLSEIHRTLKPGGAAIICTENLSSWHNIIALLFGWQPFSLANVSQKKYDLGNPLGLHAGEDIPKPKTWQHMRVFAYRGLKDLFLEHGFRLERIEGSGYYPLPTFVGRIDPRHAAFLTVKVRKPAQ